MLTVEWWKLKTIEPLPTRNPLCGHTAQSDAKPAFEGTELSECPVCRTAALSGLTRFSWTDFNPNAQLQWDLAERTRSRSIPALVNRQVRSASSFPAKPRSHLEVPVPADVAPRSRLLRGWLFASELSSKHSKTCSSPCRCRVHRPGGRS